MADVSFQDVFNRVFSYLRESGVEMTVETYRSLLRLIEEAVASVDEPNRGDRILAAAMDPGAPVFPAAGGGTAPGLSSDHPGQHRVRPP